MRNKKKRKKKKNTLNLKRTDYDLNIRTQFRLLH